MRTPDFFVFGAVKCGTTSMYHYLSQHPQVFLPTLKEPQLFCDDLDYPRPRGVGRDRRRYLALYEDARPHHLRLGDTSPQYLHSPGAAAKVAAFEPAARLIVMLREPVSLLASWHRQCLYVGDEEEADLERALALEPARRAGGWTPRSGRWTHPPAYLHYRRMIALDDHVERVLTHFPREQVLFLALEEMKRDPRGTFARVCRFIEVDDTVEVDLGVHNAAKVNRSEGVRRLLRSPPPGLVALGRHILPREPTLRVLQSLAQLNTRPAPRTSVDPELAARLRAELRPRVERLEGLTGLELADLWYPTVPPPALPPDHAPPPAAAK